MKLKIREKTELVVPYYITVGEFNTPYTGITIKDKIKYLVLPINILPIAEISISVTYNNSLPLSFYTSMKSWADKNISDLHIIVGPRQPSPFLPPGNFNPWYANGVYEPKPQGRLERWFSPLFYPKPTIFNVLNGLTAVAGVNPATTYDEFGIFSNFNSTYGILNTTTTVETRLQAFKDGITGGKNLIKRPYSFNDFNTNNYDTPSPLWSYSGPPKAYKNTQNFTLPINKLLYVLEDVDQRHTLNVPQYLSLLAQAWRYQREIYQNNSGIIPNIKTQEQIDALNTDILNHLKIYLNEKKTQYPLARPQNGCNPSDGRFSTVPWAYSSTSVPAGLCGPGVRQTPFPLGATADYMAAEGVTYNTWSPKGWTRDQGMYLFDGWGLQWLLEIMYHMTDAPGNVNPVMSQKQLLADPEWGNILNDVRILMTKEVFDHLKHMEEGRPWYSKRKYWNDGGIKDGYVWPSKTYPDGTNWNVTKPFYQQYQTGGGYFYPDVDNKGYITSNQNVTPMAYRILAAMYLYPYAKKKEERQGLIAAYDAFMEYWASMLERFMYGTTEPTQCGHWGEGWAYAAQSMPDFMRVLDLTRRMGDRRLWDNFNTPDYFNPSKKGVQYKHWGNNAWKWVLSRIMPNNMIINSGSCNTPGWETTGNWWQFYPYSVLLQAALLAEDTESGSTGSALAEMWDWWRPDVSDEASLQWFTLVKQYKKGPIKDKVLPKGYYTSPEKIFAWKSDIVVPKDHSDWLFGTSSALKNNFSKPLIFGIWGKGVGVYEEKNNQDGSHISAYLGDAVLLLETGEPRQLWDGTQPILDYFYTDTYKAKGHNKMQLGERLDPASPKPIEWVNIRFGDTGGYAFIDATDVYNRLGLTGPAYGWNNLPEGYLHQTNSKTFYPERNGDPNFYLSHHTRLVPYTIPSGPDAGKYAFQPYQYQIRTCTRGVTWNYYNNKAKIEIEDIVGISYINPLFPGAAWTYTGPYATGPDTRVYYRFHVGYTGASAPNVFPFANAGVDTGLTFYSIQGTNNKEWNVAWKQPIPYNATGGTNYTHVGITMSFIADQPIRLQKEMTINHSFKYASRTMPGVGITAPSRHYAIDVLLGLSGGVYHDEYNLKLNTILDAQAFLP